VFVGFDGELDRLHPGQQLVRGSQFQSRFERGWEIRVFFLTESPL
jgi:hypothetical protein